MSRAKRIWTAAFSVGAVVVAGAPHYHRTRPALNCGLPDRDYQYRSFSQPLQSLSASPILVATAANLPLPTGGAVGGANAVEAKGTRIKYFQFTPNATLRSDHCSLTNISILVHASGDWSLSMRAEQNPIIPPSSPADLGTNEAARKFTAHLQRNEFHVQVRCFAGYGAVDGGLLGKPLVVPLHVSPFWVQRQQPQQVYKFGHDQRIADYFEMIDRTEMEFRYREE